MMGVSRRARKRTNRGHSKNKDKMCEKNKQKKHIGALGRSFVHLFRRSNAYFYRFFLHSPSLPSVALRLPVGKFLFFLTFPVLYFPMFALHARLVDIWVGREGRFGFIACKGGCCFSPIFFLLLPPSSSVFLLFCFRFFLLAVYSLYDTPLACSTNSDNLHKFTIKFRMGEPRNEWLGGEMEELAFNMRREVVIV